MLVLLLAAVSVSGQSTDDLFAVGNKHYEAKQFDSAAAAYLQLVEQGTVSAPLHFNLGNAYFKTGDLGQAILHYLKAKRLDPADEDIAQNLEFAQRFTSVQMEGVALNPVSSLFEAMVAPYRLDLLAWISSACFFLFLALLIARFGLGFTGSSLKAGIWFSLSLLLIASVFTTVKYEHDYLTQRAVIIADEGVVRTGPSELSDKELDTAPGLVVEILSESGDYYNVLFENKRRGWIKKDLVAVV
jgi:tetratricopeptide (TPR) repeat protein